MKKETFAEIRFSLYFTFFISGIIIQWVAPFQYKCNFTDEKCFACGLRTAVDLFLHGKFLAAYQSNKLIVALVIAGVLMSVDVLLYLYRHKKSE